MPTRLVRRRVLNQTTPPNNVFVRRKVSNIAPPNNVFVGVETRGTQVILGVLRCILVEKGRFSYSFNPMELHR
jgi:hypothetical protein